jgi:FlaG protein
MSFEIGPISPLQGSRPAQRTAAPSTGFSLELARAGVASPVDSAQLSLPAYPPREVQDEVDRAAERAAELASRNRELHFSVDEETGRVVVQVRDLEGNVIRTIPPSEALDVMAGAGL